MRKLLLLVSAVVLVDTMFFAGLTPLLPDFADRFQLSKSGAGLLTAAYAAGGIVGALPGGLLASRLGVKPAVVLGLGVMSATSIVFGFAGNVWTLDIARFLQGVGSAFSWTGALAWLVAAAPRQRRGELIGVAMGVAGAGGLLGPVLGGVASLVGTAPAFSAVAALGGALALAAWATPALRPERRPVGRALGAAVLEPRLAAGLWLVALSGILFGALSVLAPLKLSRLGFGALAIGTTFVAGAALEAAVNPLLGRLSDRRGRLGPIRGGLLASAALSLAIPWTGERWALAALVAGAGLAYGSFWTPGMALLSDGAESFGLDYAFTFALMNLAWAPGDVVGSWLGGALAQASGDTLPFLATACFCLLTLAWSGGRRLGSREGSPAPEAVEM